MTKDQRIFYSEMALGIAQRRRSLRLTLPQLSKLSGLSQGELRDVESGDLPIYCFEFFKIMDTFDKVEAEKSTVV